MPATRRRTAFDPASPAPFKLSRSKLELFLDCPRCFYLDRRLGIGRVQGPAFTLNSAVDVLLKAEFDGYRAAGEPHPLMRAHGLDAVPFAHPDLDRWRENFVGVRHHHAPTNLLLFGAVDDVWVDREGTLIVVDYKATCTEKPISLEDAYRQAYKRQMEFYQWLLRRNGFEVSDRGYFVYANGRKNRGAFEGRLEFAVDLIPYDGSDGWVEEALALARACLVDDEVPVRAEGCAWCTYAESAGNHRAAGSQSGNF